jgi:hypothetical protein
MKPFSARVLTILWPAFMAAAVLEMVVFAVVDPEALHGFGVEPLGWTRSAVYSLAFFVFWAVTAMAAAMTQFLDTPDP